MAAIDGSGVGHGVGHVAAYGVNGAWDGGSGLALARAESLQADSSGTGAI
jgi:hypothetical protein